MSITAIGLILASALLHATWNFLGKVQATPSLYFYFYATLFSAIVLTLLLLPVAFFSFSFSILTLGNWHWVLLTGLCQTLYLFGLAKSYHQLELSVAYPLVRALPILFVPILCIFLFEEQSFSSFSWAGFLFIFLGTVLLIPIKAFLTAKMNSGLFWIFLAALGTCGYSIIDFEVQKHWLSELNSELNSTHEPVSKWQISLLYTCALNWATVIIMGIWIYLTKNLSTSTEAVKPKRQQAYAGLMITGSYLLVLIAMNYSDQISDIVAFRQISIPIGFMLGILILKESVNVFKLSGLICVCVGLYLVA